MCIFTMSKHSVYLVSDLQGSDNGDPLNGIIIVVAVRCSSESGPRVSCPDIAFGEVKAKGSYNL